MLGLSGGTAFAAKAIHRDTASTPTAPTAYDFTWVKYATEAEARTAKSRLTVGVQHRPGVLLETDYYVYPYTDPDTASEVTAPSLVLSMNSNGYAAPVTMYMYWQDRNSGQRLYIANGQLLDPGEVQDIFGTSGTPIWAPDLTDFYFFGPNSAWGSGPQNPTGLYMFGFELRDASGSEVISRGYALYNHIDGFVTVDSDILTDTLWTANNAYLLAKGGEDFPVHVGGKGTQGQTEAISPTVLTIEPGTVIFGDKDALGTLSVARGSKLIANGTPMKPIIMTSSFKVGQRSSGDWGGLVLNGWAPVGADTGEREGEGETGFFGGDDPNDSSGVLSYVRVEFAGVLFTTEDELNGIALQGVGAGTVINHVQVNRNADDGIEFFGGTVNATNVLLTGIEDDSFDWTFGWTGSVNNVVAWQGYNVNGDQGIEADNDRSVPNREPRSMPKIFNATFIGAFGDEGNDGDLAILFRRGTGAIIRDAIFMNFADCGPTVHDEETYDQIDEGGLVLANTILWQNTNVTCAGEGVYFDQDRLDDWLNDPTQSVLSVDPQLADPYNSLTPDLHPLPGGNADNAGNAAPSNYIGGLAPGDNWIYEPWTTFARD
jgi:hypothetical protein